MQAFSRHTDPGVDDFQSQAAPGPAGANLYGACIGEFDGIAEQIVQNLTGTGGVPQKMFWQIRRGLVNQVNAFAPGLLSVQGCAFFNQFSHAERNAFQGEFASLYLGDVENVVEQAE